MEKIRVLIVDDSLLVRRALRECFRSDPEIEVVGVAETGVRALEQIGTLKPDIVTLDIEMPEMDGLETLKTLRAQGSTIPVIMFSKYTSEGATATLEALELGASDAVAKPETHGGKGISCEVAKRQLTTRIRALGRKFARTRKVVLKRDVAATVGSAEEERFVAPQSIEAVAFAISTGGPSALIEIVAALSVDIDVPIFITQHMPPMFTKFLAERLTARGTLPAHEVEDGMIAKPGNIYIAPGNYHLEVARKDAEVVVGLSQAPHENSCRPSADVMFRSLASAYGPRLLSIVMTGMGQDGKKGCEYVKSHGGTVVAQDEASSLVWGMPRAVISAGLHDAIVPLSGMATLINQSCSKAKKERT
jgi:two-component system chemotaxis response regulator CheB